MADFNIRSESVDVEQIMKQIRARVREKRGVDYTEDQVRELATVRLEKFLDPKNLRSDLLEQFRRSRPALQSEPPPVEPPYEFNDQTLFETHRGLLRFIRNLLKPILKLFFNPNPLINVLHTQGQFNADLLKREQRRKIEFDRSRAEWNALYYEVLHNLVLETTRSGIEIKNLKMRLEALASRLDFSERRVRALEGVVQYRPEALRRPDREQRALAAEDGEPGSAGVETENGAGQPGQPGEGRRRRRRRRGRRAGAAAAPGTPGLQPQGGMHGEFDEATSEEQTTENDGVEDDAAPRTDGGLDAEPEPSARGDAQRWRDDEPFERSEKKSAPPTTAPPSEPTPTDDDLQ
jgi:hypothetical protein